MNKTEKKVCLILEGSYPYVRGGVSSWMHNIIKNLPDTKFSILHIAGNKETTKEIKYDLPDNVTDIHIEYLHDIVLSKRYKRQNNKKAWNILSEFYYEILEKNNLEIFDEFYDFIIDNENRGLSLFDFIYSKKSWDIMLSYYKKYFSFESFVDFFWTCRFLHLPLLKMFQTKIPEASLYHAISTGYAGLLGVIAHKKYNKPFIITEHGIYHYERKIEIQKADWIYTKKSDEIKVKTAKGSLKKMWINKFDLLSRISYKYAEEIITLFEGNKKMQTAMGADEQKISIIPNGIFLPPDADIKKSNENIFRIAFIGRIVPIKDVKGFIKVCKIINEKLNNPKNLKIMLIGPKEEEKNYYKECMDLIKLYNLSDFIEITGNLDLNKFYNKIDLAVLTSISEAQPLVVLEAMSWAIPCVTTDVGACRELLYGADEEDKQLGASGVLVGFGDIEELANTIIRLYVSRDIGRKMGEAGRERVRQYYTQDKLITSYRKVYKNFEC